MDIKLRASKETHISEGDPQRGQGRLHGIARFEAECQALALMDHPNIARVLDEAPRQAAGRIP